ncbi:hypothetical protein [Chryseolinea serpens]|uniref:hypothetical protein n=1 Tax=Chryseolinea serpens TaxID=947013 RepID=UPI0015C020EC|nr:hypothetical protein [Chryseolinea serpens]
MEWIDFRGGTPSGMGLEAGLLVENTNNGVATAAGAKKLFFVVVAGERLVARSFHYSY